MMTREEAKTKICPYREHTAFLRYEGEFIYEHEQKRASLCLAESCPKWRDGEEVMSANEVLLTVYCRTQCKKFKTLCAKNVDNVDGVGMLKLKLTHCNHCPKRYGYCGG